MIVMGDLNAEEVRRTNSMETAMGKFELETKRNTKILQSHEYHA